MAIVSIKSVQEPRTHEDKAEAMREMWGENTIVWFSKKSHYAVYGKDAELTAKIYGKLLDNVIINDELVAYLPKSQYDWRTATAISQGHKIVILQD